MRIQVDFRKNAYKNRYRESDTDFFNPIKLYDDFI